MFSDSASLCRFVMMVRADNSNNRSGRPGYKLEYVCRVGVASKFLSPGICCLYNSLDTPIERSRAMCLSRPGAG